MRTNCSFLPNLRHNIIASLSHGVGTIFNSCPKHGVLVRPDYKATPASWSSVSPNCVSLGCEKSHCKLLRMGNRFWPRSLRPFGLFATFQHTFASKLAKFPCAHPCHPHSACFNSWFLRETWIPAAGAQFCWRNCSPYLQAIILLRCLPARLPLPCGYLAIAPLSTPLSPRLFSTGLTFPLQSRQQGYFLEQVSSCSCLNLSHFGGNLPSYIQGLKNCCCFAWIKHLHYWILTFILTGVLRFDIS